MTAPDQRGITTIPSAVVAQIAAQAAYETAHGARRDFHSRPEADCELYGQVAVLHLNLGLTFPTPVASTIQHLRDYVREHVEHLTGLTVGKITIDISWLNPNDHVRKALQ